MTTLAAPPGRARGAAALPPPNGKMAQIRQLLRLRGHRDVLGHQPSDVEGVRELLAQHGAIQEGHFKYESGRHGEHYVEKFRLLERPQISERLCSQIAEQFEWLCPEVVAGPTTGGLLLAYETARALGDEVLAFFAEPSPSGDGRLFGRGFSFVPDQPVLIVDDVLTTGGSVRDTIDAVRAGGGRPIGVGVVVDRTNGTAAPDGRLDGIPFYACTRLEVPSYAPGECPLCVKGIELTET